MNPIPDRKLPVIANDVSNGEERCAATRANGWEEPMVQRARLGDIAAFEWLMKDNFQRIYRTALRIAGDPSDADDIAQETFLRAYRCLVQFRGGSKFSTWLTRIAVNQSLMHLRKNRNHQVLLTFDTEDGTVEWELPDHSPNPEQAYGSCEFRQKIDRAISRLPPNLRSAFEVRHFHEFTTEETSRLLRISVPAVKSRILRARRILREHLLYSGSASDGNGLVQSKTGELRYRRNGKARKRE